MKEMGIGDWGYRHIVRPALFRFEPEVAHGLTIKGLKLLGFWLDTKLFVMVLVAFCYYKVKRLFVR